jgi:uncharacterized protein
MGQPVVHFEIVGADAEKLQSFYSALFGWEFDADDVTNYGIIRREDNTNAQGLGIGGGVGATPAGSPGYVTFYVEVPDVEAALATVVRLGGSRLFGPDRISDDVAFGVFTDPEGHLIGVLGPG